MEEGEALSEHPERPDRGQLPRLTPYELVFGDPGIEHRIFPALLDEAERQGEDTTRPERFGFVAATGDVVRELVPTDAPYEMLEQYRSILYHAFNFWRWGRRFYSLDAAVARYLVEARPGLAGWDLALPHRSTYVQLPANLFWASISTDVPPEPVDGFFVTVTETRDPLGGPARQLVALMVLGMRRERAGFSVIPFETEYGPGITATWAEAPGREAGADFANILPGGEMKGLYSILTTTEALKLLARIFWYVDQHPDDVDPRSAPERRTEDRPGTVPLSRLNYHRVRFSGDVSFQAEGAAG